MEAKPLDEGTYLTSYWYTSTKLGKITRSIHTDQVLLQAAIWGD